MGIKVYNNLPPEIQDFSHNIKKLKSSLRGFLHQYSFYTLEGYFNYTTAIGYILTAKLIFIFHLFCMKFWGRFLHVRYILYNIKDDTVPLYIFVDCK
jgi:hypothetical protein